jgi:hypothetical protein
MMGDGMSDLETKPDVDDFIGFGGVVARPKIEQGSDHWLADMGDRSVLNDIISSKSLDERKA